MRQEGPGHKHACMGRELAPCNVESGMRAKTSEEIPREGHRLGPGCSQIQSSALRFLFHVLFLLVSLSFPENLVRHLHLVLAVL